LVPFSFNTCPFVLSASPQELKTLLDYGRKLSKYANDEDLIPGLGMPTLHGGPWDVETKKRDVREVFKTFVEEGVAREGAFTPQVRRVLENRV
jgi:hypothetical protein